jgi:uncharacterized protein
MESDQDSSFNRGVAQMNSTERPLALVTGAASGVGRQLAVECARHGLDLMVTADTPLDEVVRELRGYGEAVEFVEADLATMTGVDTLYGALNGRVVDALLADVGQDSRHAVDTRVAGTVRLIQKVAHDMAAAKAGRILIAGADAFSQTLRSELQDSGVTVSCLISPACGMEAAEVARIGFDAMLEGEREIAPL